MQRTKKALPRLQIEREKRAIWCNLAAPLLRHSICMDVSRPPEVYSACTNPDLTLQSVAFMRGILSRGFALLYIHSLFDAF